MSEQHQWVLARVAGDRTELVQEPALLASAGVHVARRKRSRQVVPTGLAHPPRCIRAEPDRELFVASQPNVTALRTPRHRIQPVATSTVLKVKRNWPALEDPQWATRSISRTVDIAWPRPPRSRTAFLASPDRPSVRSDFFLSPSVRSVLRQRLPFGPPPLWRKSPADHRCPRSESF